MSLANTIPDGTTYNTNNDSKRTLPRDDYELNSIITNNSEEFIYNNSNEQKGNRQTNTQDEILKYEPVVPNIIIDKNVVKQNNFVSLQKWEGYVVNVVGSIINVRVIDLTNDGTEEFAELYFDDIPDDDKELVVTGAVFYWSIGYLNTISGQRIRSSIIKFRRLPQWTSSELENIKHRVDDIKEKLRWE